MKKMNWMGGGALSLTLMLVACTAPKPALVMEAGGVKGEAEKPTPPKDEAEEAKGKKTADAEKPKGKSDPKPKLTRKVDAPAKVAKALAALDPNKRETEMIRIVAADGKPRNVHVRSVMTELQKFHLARGDKQLFLTLLGMEILICAPGDTVLLEHDQWIALGNTKKETKAASASGDDSGLYGLFFVVKQYRSPLNRVDLGLKVSKDKNGKSQVDEIKNTIFRMWFNENLVLADPVDLDYIGVALYKNASGSGKDAAMVFGVTNKQKALWANAVFDGMNLLYSKKAGPIGDRPTATEWDARIGPGTGKRVRTVAGDPAFIPMVFRVSVSLPNWQIVARQEAKSKKYRLLLQCKSKEERMSLLKKYLDSDDLKVDH